MFDSEILYELWIFELIFPNLSFYDYLFVRLQELNIIFEPIIINITIENAKEYNAILEMTSRDITITEMFDEEYKYIVKEFLNKIFFNIQK